MRNFYPVLSLILISHGYRWGLVLSAASALICCAAYVNAPAGSGLREQPRACPG